MRNTTPESDPSRNGLVIQPATKPPQTVREYLASSSNAAFNEQVKAACAKRGLDLDSPWPMKLGGVAVTEPATAQAPESAARRDSLLIRGLGSNLTGFYVLLLPKPHVLRETLQNLARQRIVAPGYRFLQEMVGRVVAGERKRVTRLLGQALTPTVREQLTPC